MKTLLKRLRGLAELARNMQRHHDKTGSWNSTNVDDLVAGVLKLQDETRWMR